MNAIKAIGQVHVFLIPAMEISLIHIIRWTKQIPFVYLLCLTAQLLLVYAVTVHTICVTIPIRGCTYRSVAPFLPFLPSGDHLHILWLSLCNCTYWSCVKHICQMRVQYYHAALVLNMKVQEPSLQPLSGESLNHCTVNKADDTRVDICARGFWNKMKDTSLAVLSLLVWFTLLVNRYEISGMVWRSIWVEHPYMKKCPQWLERGLLHFHVHHQSGMIVKDMHLTNVFPKWPSPSYGYVCQYPEH